jgi:ABC-2 type transport system permease protein
MTQRNPEPARHAADVVDDLHHGALRRRREIWIAFRTIVTREVRRFVRIWPQTLLPPAITMALYFVIFGNLIGPRIGRMDGHGYMDFIVPGLIMMAVITNSYSNVVSSFFSLKFQRSVEELLVAPVPNWVILLGFVTGGVARGLAVGVIVTLLSLCFTELTVHHIGITVLVVFLTAVLFSLGGFVNAMYARSFDDISVVPAFVLTPLTYLGGVFYSVSLLPEFWQWVSRSNPILYMVNAFRYGMLGVSDIDIGLALVMTVGFILVLGGMALHLLNSGRGIRS